MENETAVKMLSATAIAIMSPAAPVVSATSYDFLLDISGNEESQKEDLEFFLTDVNVLEQPKQSISQLSKTQLFFRNHYLNILKDIENDPLAWVDEGTQAPNDFAIKSAEKLINDLVIENIFPDRITTTVEEGLMLTFANGLQKMYLEIYNDESLGYIIEDTSKRKMIENEDIDSLENVKERLIAFIQE